MNLRPCCLHHHREKNICFRYTFNKCEDQSFITDRCELQILCLCQAATGNRVCFMCFLFFNSLFFLFHCFFMVCILLACFIALATLPPVTSRIVPKRFLKKRQGLEGKLFLAILQDNFKCKSKNLAKMRGKTKKGSRKNCFWQFSTTILEAKA